MAKDPSVSFYPGDFLIGTFYFTYEQKGQYIQLLCEQQQLGHTPEERMREVCGSLQSKVVRKFARDENGDFYNERMEDEINRRKKFIQNQINNINKRWEKKQKEDTVVHTTVNTSVIPVRVLPLEKEIEIEKENINLKKGKRKKEISEIESSLIIENSELRDAWILWLSYKREQFRFTYKPIGEQTAFNGLLKLAEGDQARAVELINYAMEHTWQGFYLPKNETYDSKKISEIIPREIIPRTEEFSKSPDISVSETRSLRPGDPGYLMLLGYRSAEEVCPGYEWTPEIREIMNTLTGYFFRLNIPHTEEIDPRKGIALIGTYGIGKTVAFRVIHRMLERRYSHAPDENVMTFRETSVEDIITAMKADDFSDGILFKRMESVDGARVSRPLNILINEFGVEYTGKHFGTPISEMLEIFLMKRYEIFQTTGKVTHATMNYSLAELNRKFPPKLIDRFREMFNFVTLSGKSFRS